eukprot:11868834-Ditylum_brightwellii.AAC.1
MYALPSKNKQKLARTFSLRAGSLNAGATLSKFSTTHYIQRTTTTKHNGMEKSSLVSGKFSLMYRKHAMLTSMDPWMLRFRLT